MEQELYKIRLKLNYEIDEELLELIYEDAKADILDLTNRDEILPKMLPLVREVALIYCDRCHNDIHGNITSMSQGDVSISYGVDIIPTNIVNRIKRYSKSKMCWYAKGRDK